MRSLMAGTTVGLLLACTVHAATPALPLEVAVTREGYESLPTHTIYRPTDLTKFKQLPIVLWDNGDCADDNSRYATMLTRIAGAGYVVIAKGPASIPPAAILPKGPMLHPKPGVPDPAYPGAAVPANHSYTKGTDEFIDKEVALMLAPLDWVVQENDRNGSPLVGKLDTTKIAASGYSCGGVTSIAMGTDSRIKAILGFNTASWPDIDVNNKRRQALQSLTIPQALINGGPSDFAYYAGELDYAMPTTRPFFKAEHLYANHFGPWQATDFQLDVARIAINWLDFALRGDELAAAYLFSSPCGFCTDSFWSTKARNVPPSAAGSSLVGAGGLHAAQAAKSESPQLATPASPLAVAVTREGYKSLPTHTIYRPTDLTRFKELPIVLWDNNACINDNAGHAAMLARVASAGYLIIAKGPASIPPTVLPQSSPLLHPVPAPAFPGGASPLHIADPAGVDAAIDSEAALMLATLDWAANENVRNGSPLKGKLDTTKVAASGFSCGGITSIAMAADRRIKSILGFNTASWSDIDVSHKRRQALRSVAIPQAWINGGPSDIAYYAGELDFAMPATRPLFKAEHAYAGHFGFWQATDFQLDVARIAVNWLDFTLRGDEVAGAYLFASPCGFCVDSYWSTKVRNVTRTATE